MIKRGNRLYCFSPPVMIITGIVEIALLFWVLWRYKSILAVRLIALLLLLLAIFQVAEFNVCTGSPQHVIPWSRLGFIAITLLPILSMHLIYSITGKLKGFVWAGYVTALPWVGLFLLPGAFENYRCTGNYVIFHLNMQYHIPYLAYYYAWLLVGVAACFYYGNDKANKHRRALHALGIGYLSFILPTTFANTLSSATVNALPSIMCGFAILYAVLLAGVVAPALAEPKKPL